MYPSTSSPSPYTSHHLNDSRNNNNENQNQSSSSDSTNFGLSSVAAQFDSINPMFKSMRDLERTKSQQLHNLEDKLHQRDLEILHMKKQMEQLRQENSKLKLSLKNFQDHPLIPSSSVGNHDLSSSASFRHHKQFLGKERQTVITQAEIASTNLGSALSPKQMNVPRHTNNNNRSSSSSSALMAPDFASSSPPQSYNNNSKHDNSSSTYQQTHQQQTSSNNNNNNSNSIMINNNIELQQHQQQQKKALEEKQELEDMLSRSIARLADAERALVSERTRFLVVDPGLISMDRWRAAVSRLADLHDEVAHRRFGACLAAARLSGQLPDDLPQVTATQYLRASLSPVVLQLIANSFRKREKEEGVADDVDSSFFHDDANDDDGTGGRMHKTKSRTTGDIEERLVDPWREKEIGLVEEPDVLLHHVNCILERLTLDPGDDYVQ